MSRDFARFKEPDWEPEPIERCIECDMGIYEGDEYYDYNGDYYCAECGQALKIDSEDFEINAVLREAGYED